MITTYLEAREYLESLIKPIPYRNSDTDAPLYDPLERMRVLLSLLGNPEREFKSIQVSGTSGKGSTAYLISHLLTAAGYKTGFTLSPHLMRITERFQINEKQILEDDLLSLINKLVPIVAKMKDMEVGEPTYFEALMSLTFLYFAREKVDIAVVEVGLEGRYDGTNTLNPLLFVLTNVSLDHVEFLGDTNVKIASEAMGAIENKNYESRIMNNGKALPTVITGVEQKDVQQVVREVCAREELPLRMLGYDFWCDIQEVSERGVLFDYQPKDFCMHELFVSLTGEYQAPNATLALEAVCGLQQFGFTVTEETIREALKTAHFPGRFEKILISHSHVIARNEAIHSLQDRHVASTPRDDSVEIILDGAHNPAKMEAFVTSLQKIYPDEKYIVIFACKKDKDITEIIKKLSSVVDTLIVTQYHVNTEAAKNSSMAVSDVLQQVEKAHIGSKVLSAENIQEAFRKALEIADNQRKIVITGSLYLVGEMKTYLTEQE